MDVLSLKQGYNYYEKNDAWVLINQSITVKVNFLGFKVDGKFSYAYSNYNFLPNFTKNTFTSEVLSFAKEPTKKDTAYWNTLRPVPLTSEEIKDYSIKDSIKIIRKSKKYLDSVDRKRNKFTLSSPIFGYTYRNSYKKWVLSFNSPISKISFNTVQGFNSSAGFSYFKRQNDKGKWWNIRASVNYGLSEKKVRPTFSFSKKWNNSSRPRMSISGGITTSQFNNRQPISRLENMVYSLLDKRNYMKIYEKTFANISYSSEIRNGIYFNSSLEYANRKPLFNTTDYSFVSKNYDYTSNNPLDESDFTTAPFDAHTIWTATIGANIVFGQKYLSYPHGKFNVGNDKYPSLYLGYRKTFGANNTTLNSDLLFANLSQDVSLGNYGRLNYNIRSGLFLKKKNIAFMDYLHPSGNKLSFISGNRLTNFGLLDYYKFSTNDKYAEAHIMHNFKGFILGKIPLINKLNFHLVSGAKSLFTADKKPYTEYSIGLNNIGWGKWRFLRVDYIRSNYGDTSNSGFLFGVNLFN